ncbi:MAG: Unknown protein [uncultured Sulfurovum sp.]|uniref:Uncharacterized protein n=1 Tax=uncultured Sulfurovum sp. TaxID=269237 RepID=A0A6S6TZV6_9BACT|nr:MAG: Unknown protein [uncultured Sulfurovum sp.]
MKLLLKIWDKLLFIFAFSATKHCEKITLGEDDDFTRGNH